jgi:hypothetical protein
VGIDLDQQLLGFEIEPLELILEMVKELKLSNKTLAFESYTNIAELEKYVMEANK